MIPPKLTLRTLSLNLCLGLLLTACNGVLALDIETVTAPAASATPTRSAGTAMAALSPEASPPNPAISTIQIEPSPFPLATFTLAATQPVTPETPTPCVPPAKWAPYTIKPGDTLFDLSLRTNISVATLQSANCLSSTVIRVGQQVYLPYIPTPTATPSATLTPTPPLPTPDPQAEWAPGNKRYATHQGVVVDIEQYRVAVVVPENTPWLKFWGWTTEGRFAIFTRVNQYANGRMTVFDTHTWAISLETNGCGSPSIRCGEHPFKRYAYAPRLLRLDGWLVDLPAGPQIDLLASWRSGSQFIHAAEWSPDGAQLAFVANAESETSYALYLSRGDGSQSQRITPIDSYPQSIQWAADNKTVTLTTSNNRYILDVLSKQFLVVPAATSTPMAAATATQGQ